MVSCGDIESWIGHKTVPFHYGHLALMDLKSSARGVKESIPNYLQYMRDYTAGTPAFSVIHQGKVLLSFGFYPLWPGVSEGWMIPSNQLDRKAIALVKGSRTVFDKIGSVLQLRRLQFMVSSSNLQAIRFAEVLYFEREATLARYGPEGDDYYIYARFY
jgi:hypothetical protein